MPTPTFGGGVNLIAVASLPSGRSWAVGLSGSGDGPTSGVILQWTGTAWTRVPIPDLGSDDGGLFGLAATSRSNAWAVGWESAGGNPAGTPKIVILRWNGTAWSDPSPSPVRPRRRPVARHQRPQRRRSHQLRPRRCRRPRRFRRPPPLSAPSSEVRHGVRHWVHSLESAALAK